VPRKIDGAGGRAGQKLRLVKSNEPTKKIAFAFTDGTLVGQGRDGPCTWMYFVVTKTPVSGRHQWVTAYPVDETYVTDNLA
jgi:hypothetical protein